MSLPEVDVVLDLDAPLPFQSDSVELVLMSHSLEHVRDLMDVMREVYRICRHGARVCIVAPYSSQGLNTANPYHTQVLNEHSPRFWTDSPHSAVEPAEYAHPQAGDWGLSRSDCSEPGLDFRCVSLEFFYFPEYQLLSPEEQREARKTKLDVCDQILYQLIAVKTPTSAEELEALGDATAPYEPPHVSVRRARDEVWARTVEIEALQADVRSRDEEIGLLGADLESTRAEVDRFLGVIRAQSDNLSTQQAAIQRLQFDFRGQRNLARALERDLRSRDEDIQERDTALRDAKTVLHERDAELEKRSGEIEALQDTLRARTEEVGQLQARVADREAAISHLTRRGLAVAGEADRAQQRRSARLLERLQRSGAGLDVAPPFRQLLDDSHLFGDVRGFELRAGPNLQRVELVSYRLEPRRGPLLAVLLAPIVDVPGTEGTLGLEIASSEERIMARAAVRLDSLDELTPARLDLDAPVDTREDRFSLRVFVRDSPGPVRIYEWSRYRLAGLGPCERRLFAGLVFAE